MANLGAFEIPVSNKWSDLSELTGITFEADEKYRMQVTKGAEGVYVAVKDEEPDEKEGYVVSTNNPFIYIAEDKKKGLFSKKVVIDVYEFSDIVTYAENVRINSADDEWSWNDSYKQKSQLNDFFQTVRPLEAKEFEIVSQVPPIAENIGSVNSVSQDLKLRRENRIKTIHGSIAIEQNSLTLEQVTNIIDGKIVVGPKKDIL